MLFRSPIMKKNGGGVILNNASFAGLMPQAGKGCYAASKSGMITLTRALAGELAPFGIRVAAIVPGPTVTRMTEENYKKNLDKVVESLAVQRVGAAEEIAKFAVFMASDAASFFTGGHIEITGGKYCIQDPATPWNYYAKELAEQSKK